MQYLDAVNVCVGNLVKWNEETGNGKVVNHFVKQLVIVLSRKPMSLCCFKCSSKNVLAVMNKGMCTGLVLLILVTSNVTTVAAEPNVDTEDTAEKELVEHVDYEELAGIFKKYNGKHDYTIEQVKTLKRAPLSQTKLKDGELKKLSRLQGVLLWNLGRCHNLTRDSLPVIKSLTSARAVDLADTKLFQDYDEIVDTFKDYKNLEFLSIHLVGKEPTEKYKAFLEARPQLTALVGVYSQKVEGGYRLKHKEALHALIKKWLDEGVITQAELKGFK